jgi:HEAT repeat protein
MYLSPRTLGVTTLLTLLVAGAVYGQPHTPKDKIPPRIPRALREQILKLYSSDPVERGQACDEIGALGEKGAPAIPFLAEMLSDTTPVMQYTRVGDHTVITAALPGVLAAKALARMGSPGFTLILSELRASKDPKARRNVAWALGEVHDKRAISPLIQALNDESEDVRYQAAKALATITGQDFGNDSAKWREWLNGTQK